MPVCAARYSDLAKTGRAVGNIKQIRHKGIIWRLACGELHRKKVRRGAHAVPYRTGGAGGCIWYFRSLPNKIGCLLDACQKARPDHLLRAVCRNSTGHQKKTVSISHGFAHRKNTSISSTKLLVKIKCWMTTTPKVYLPRWARGHWECS